MELNTKYNYPQISTKQVIVDTTLQSYFILREDHVEWCGEYYATYIDEEDEELSIKKDVARYHKWLTFYKKELLTGVEMFRVHDDEYWQVKIFNSGSGNNIIVLFHKQQQAEKLLNLFTEYIFGFVPEYAMVESK